MACQQCLLMFTEARSNSFVHDQLPRFKFGMHSISLDYHQLYIAIVVNTSVCDWSSPAVP